MNHNSYLHPQPPHDDSSGFAHAPDGAGSGDAELARLVSQLDALGTARTQEADVRGVTDRVFNASVHELATARPVLARIGAHRWAGFAAAAAVLGLAVLVPMEVLHFGAPPGDGPITTISYRQAELPPAGMSEQLVVGLLDGDAALESIDPSADDGIASLVVTRGHAADSVAVEVRQLLSHGGGR